MRAPAALGFQGSALVWGTVPRGLRALPASGARRRGLRTSCACTHTRQARRACARQPGAAQAHAAGCSAGTAAAGAQRARRLDKVGARGRAHAGRQAQRRAERQRLPHGCPRRVDVRLLHVAGHARKRAPLPGEAVDANVAGNAPGCERARRASSALAGAAARGARELCWCSSLRQRGLATWHAPTECVSPLRL